MICPSSDISGRTGIWMCKSAWMRVPADAIEMSSITREPMMSSLSLAFCFRPHMRRIAMVMGVFLALFAGVLLQTAPASADVIAKVDIATQQMTVVVDGTVEAVWSVSTARRGYHTPRGTYQPVSLQKMHYSKKYHNSPMPYSVFFKGGYAVHGTPYVKQLGKAASHGCIRLAPQNAAVLFQLIRQHGVAESHLQIT